MSSEEIWSGEFGTEYTKRNDKDYSPRSGWWKHVCKTYDFANVLEVGCNTGMNLRQIAQHLDHPSFAWGIEINSDAVQICKKRNPDLNVVCASGLDIPFKDEYFGMVFTCGVLIHQTPDTLEPLMQEIIRVSNKYVMAIEYENETFVEVPYRGMRNALFKGPFGDVYEKRYGLKLIEKTYLGKEAGFDSTVAWTFARR